jgi:hypothetical protein
VQTRRHIDGSLTAAASSPSVTAGEALARESRWVDEPNEVLPAHRSQHSIHALAVGRWNAAVGVSPQDIWVCNYAPTGNFPAGAAVTLSGVDVNGVLRIADNTFYDNADGVVLYQNANRCCGTKDGCSGSCNPLPLYPEVDTDGNKRWNTQKVTVSNNTTIDQAITFKQNNVFENNTYTGSWQFLSPDQGSSLLTPAAWQAAPFNQDPGSVFH